jgi:hypothetical protein
LGFYDATIGGGRQVQPRKIFLSYRREDSAAAAGRLSDRLALELGNKSVFMDVDGIPLGVDFVKRLQLEVASCDTILAVIGPRWLDIVDEDGNRRLDNPNDFVRVEIAAALQRDIPVIPILLDGTTIPRRDRLPDDLKNLSNRNGLHVRHGSFHADVGRLVRELKEVVPPKTRPPEPRQVDHTKDVASPLPHDDLTSKEVPPDLSPREDHASPRDVRSRKLAKPALLAAGLLALAGLVAAYLSQSTSEVSVGREVSVCVGSGGGDNCFGPGVVALACGEYVRGVTGADDQFAQRICGGKWKQLRWNYSRDGGRCGWSSYTVTCAQ